MTDTKALFEECWAEEIADRTKRSPSFTVDQYVATGRASKEYDGKRNQQWWLDNGHTMIDNWLAWRERTNWTVWTTPDGRPGIELELNVTLDPDLPVIKMFLDNLWVLPTGVLAVADTKTGRLPEIPEQLGLYATGIDLTYGPQYRPQWGFYWDAQKGDHGSPIDLSMWTREFFVAEYEEAIRGINAGSFLPKPANRCGNWCSTARFCYVVGGQEAHGVDPLAGPLTIATRGETNE